MNKPLCFVLMPFGRKPGSTPAVDVDFDRIYEQAIRPCIEMVGMEPIRADEERTGGIIHQVMFRFEPLQPATRGPGSPGEGGARARAELGDERAHRPCVQGFLDGREEGGQSSEGGWLSDASRRVPLEACDWREALIEKLSSPRTPGACCAMALDPQAKATAELVEESGRPAYLTLSRTDGRQRLCEAHPASTGRAPRNQRALARAVVRGRHVRRRRACDLPVAVSRRRLRRALHRQGLKYGRTS
jgi:hypothetical protein